MLSNETSFEGISQAFEVLSLIIAKISQSRGSKIDVTSRIKDYFSSNDTFFCGLLVELSGCYWMRLVLEEYLVFSKSYLRS